MICPKCGHETSGNYCNNCGARLGAGAEEPFGREQSAAESHTRADSSRHKERPANGGAGQAKRRSRRKEDAGKAQAGSTRADKKAAKQREERINKQFEAAGRERKRLEQQLERLSRERGSERLADEARDGGAEGPGFGERAAAGAAKGMLGLVILAARLMQLISCALMAGMVWTMARTFWAGHEKLGPVGTLAAEHNYGLALYLGAAGFCLAVGVLWCLWILSRKAAGGGVRLKKYDTGRGFIPFLFCAAAVLASGILSSYLPADPAALKDAGVTAAGISAAAGAMRILEAVNSQRSLLLSCSFFGAALSLVRKLLRV